MKRREFLAVLGGTAVAWAIPWAITWPLAAQAQRASAPVIGFLSLRTPAFDAALLAEMRNGLREMGYVEGQNLAIETRFAAGQFDRVAGLAEDLVRQRVNLIVTSGGTAVARAAKAVTTSIPIVFAIGDDPVEFGLVASLNRPGGNITGATNFYGTLAEKQLGLLRELIPGADTIGLLVNPNEPASNSQVRDAQTGASKVGQKLVVLTAATEAEIDAAFTAFVQSGAGALLFGANPFYVTRATQIFALAARHGLPSIYWRTELAKAGGLMSYGANPGAQLRHIGVYAGRILRGEKAADLPVIQPTKFEFVINLQTARAMRIEIPPTLLARADEVIE